MDEIFAAVDVTTLVASIVGILVVGVAVAMAFQGKKLSSRAIRQTG